MFVNVVVATAVANTVVADNVLVVDIDFAIVAFIFDVV